MPLYPKKNYIPPLTDPSWYLKSGQAMGEIVGPYEYHMVRGTVGVIGLDMPITLKVGVTYTLGGTFIGAGARLRLMKNSDETFLINLNPGNPIQTYTPTTSDLRIRVENNGQAGDFTAKDFFIYEGDISNPVFEPYEGVMKPASAMKKRLNQQVINSDTSGTGGHKYGVGNVMYVKKDIKMNDSQIIVSTAGTFNVAVYEWQDGVGVVGQAIWKRDTYYDVGTYTYSFGGLILREGKKYWFGRYDETGAANVGRTIGLGTVDYKTISTFGGARFTDSSIAFGTTYYYFYSLEIEDLDMRVSTTYAGAMKPAILYPKKNLIPRQNLVHGSWQGSPLALNTGSPLYKAIPEPLRLKPGTYYISTRGDVNVAALLPSGTILFGTNDTIPRAFTLASETDVYFHFRKKDSTTWDASTFTTDTHELQLQLELGSLTPYEPYEGIMKAL